MIETIYIEDNLQRHPRVKEIVGRFPGARQIICDRYGEVFNPKSQNFRLQKQNPALILAEIAREVLPPGVFNIVTGGGLTVGDALVRHPGVKRIAFIGSPSTGRAIQRAAAEEAVKHVTLELGGKNPLIAFPDTDPQSIADAAE